MVLAVSPTHQVTGAVSRRIRVMIVDDAIVVRGLLARWIEDESDLELVASLRNGREAVAQIERTDPDVIVLDIDMPDMDGITALPLIIERSRDVAVIMASTSTRRNAEISLRALTLGAADYIPKPESTRDVDASVTFHHELIDKIRHFGARSRRARLLVPRLQPGMKAAPAYHETTHAPLHLRPMPLIAPSALVIGASTGGPQALNEIIGHLGEAIARVPVLITQHMPVHFTSIMAEHLGRVAHLPVHEGSDGAEALAGHVYLAPGGKHMSVARSADQSVRLSITDGPPLNFCRPSVDPLFSSAAAVWGPRVLGLMLTGMGSDGLCGSRAIVESGGHLIAQDEATSVVWGMPGHVALAGLCSAVLPLKTIAPQLTCLLTGARA